MYKFNLYYLNLYKNKILKEWNIYLHDMYVGINTNYNTQNTQREITRENILIGTFILR